MKLTTRKALGGDRDSQACDGPDNVGGSACLAPGNLTAGGLPGVALPCRQEFVVGDLVDVVHMRWFGTWPTTNYLDVGSYLEREHIEAFKTWLTTTPTPPTGKPLNRVSIKNTLINLHRYINRITEWAYPTAPARPLVFIGDLLIIDEPLPRFLDEAAGAEGRRPDLLARSRGRGSGRADRVFSILRLHASVVAGMLVVLLAFLSARFAEALAARAVRREQAGAVV